MPSPITITGIKQASVFIGCVAGDLSHTDPRRAQIDLSTLDDRRFTACGITAEGCEWIGIGCLPGPAVAPAIVLFLPIKVEVVGLRRTRNGHWAMPGRRWRTKLLALQGMRWSREVTDV